MRGTPCNKCRSGRQSENNSWCLGCSSLEVSLQLFRRRWTHSGIRAVAEEAALSGARFIRALQNLDSTLESRPAAGGNIHLAAKSRAARPRSRSPFLDERPPLRRSTVSREPPPRVERDERGQQDKKPADAESEYTYDQESAEEEQEVPRIEVKREEREDRGEPSERARSHRGSERPPEPADPPEPKSEKKKKKKGKKRHRGGAKHQRHHRAQEDPFRPSHRRLDSARLDLARDLEEGLDRRA